MGFQNLDRYTKLAILVVTIGAVIRFALAIYAVPSGDGCWHLAIIRFIAQNNRLPVFEGLGREAFSYPPLFYLIGAALYKLGMISHKGIAEALPRLISPTAGVLMLILTFKLAKRFFATKIAFYSVFFLTFLPLHIFSSYTPYLDVPFACFMILSVYLFVDKRYLLGTISFACMSLIKFYGIFFFPVILIIIYFNSKKKILSAIRSTLQYGLIYLLILSPVFLRNYKIFNNPVWPFLNFVFRGTESGMTLFVSNNSIENLWNFNIVPKIFVGLFGLPNDDIRSFSFLNVPFVEMIIVLWLIGIIVYFLPFIYGLLRMKISSRKTLTLYIWIICNLFFMVILLYNINDIVARHLMPTLPAFAIFWGYGFSRFFRDDSWDNIKLLYIAVLIFIIFGFISGETIKVKLAADLWSPYYEDFGWVKANTPEDSVFLHSGECLAYHTDRETILSLLNQKQNREIYLWIQEDLHNPQRRILNERQINPATVQDKIKIYYNPDTKISIYRILD